jgi:hypothetical protein
MNQIPLPHGLQQIADAAGIEAALTIALARGGSRLLIPQKAEGSILEELVGIDAARQIAQALAGERIEIPLAKKVLNNWLKSHMSQEQRSVRLKLARRTIQNWDGDKTPPFPDLFDT